MAGGRPALRQESLDEGVGLRLLSGGRMAFAAADGTGLDAIADLVRRAGEQVKRLPADPANVLPLPRDKGGEAPAGFAGSLYDASLFSKSMDARAEELARLCERARRAEGIDAVLQAGYGESEVEIALANTRGVETYERGTYASFGLTVRARSGEDVQVCSGYQLARSDAALGFAETAEAACRRAAGQLGAREAGGGRLDLLFDPWVAGDILDLLACAMSAEATHKNASSLRGLRGRRVAASCLSVMDDPLRRAGIASGRYDDEGVPTRTALMIEHGILRDFFYDSASAFREGRSYGGSAGRDGYRGRPSAAASNFYICPGRVSRRELIADTKNGLLVSELMGMHMADPVTGEISAVLSGTRIERGRPTYPVRGVPLHCGLLELLAKVDAVADDLIFYGSLAAPTFRAAGMEVS